MAIEIIKNQPIQSKFDAIYDGHEYELMQRVLGNSDVQKIQVKCTPHTTPTDYSGASWAVAGGITHSGTTLTAAGAGTASTAISVTATARYRVQFLVNFTGIDNNGGYRVSIGGQYLKLPDASGGQYSILSGTITTYITIPILGATTIDFETTGTDTALTIRGITIALLSNVRVGLLNESKTFLNDVGIISNKPNSPISNVIIDWAAISVTGIHYLQVYDNLNYQSDLITNGGFSGSLTGWEQEDESPLHSSWSHSAGKASYDGTGASHNNTISQLLTVPGGSLYQLTFSPGGLGLTEGIKVYFYINGEVQPATNFAAGPYQVGLDLSAYTDPVELRVVFQPQTATDTFTLDNVGLQRSWDAANITNPFDIQNSQPNTLLLKGSGYGGAYNFDFEFGQQLNVRVRGTILYAEYPDKTTSFTFSNQVTDVLLSDVGKKYEVTIHGSAEYIHDAIRLIRLCDVFTINGKAYISDGDYKMDIVPGVYVRSARFMVQEKQGVALNTYEDSGSSIAIEVL